MTPQERDYILGRYQAAWPFPKMETPTALVWVEHLSPLDYPIAHRAVARLEKSAERAPSLAEFHEAYRAETPTVVHRELDGPVDKSAALRLRELVAEVTARPAKPITADMLDRAGVPNWRARLADAAHEDYEMESGRTRSDAAWESVRADYVNASAVGVRGEPEA